MKSTNTVELTPAIVRSATFPPGANGKNHRITDSVVRGFQLRISRDGSKSYWVKFHFGGRQRSYRIADGPPEGVTAARNEAFKIRMAAEEGRNLIDERKAKAARGVTLGELVPDFLKARPTWGRPIRARSLAAVKHYLGQAWKPLHPRAVADLRQPDIETALDKIAKDRGLVAADRAKAAASVFFVWCMSRGH